jgi:hypothetical protein
LPEPQKKRGLQSDHEQANREERQNNVIRPLEIMSHHRWMVGSRI